MRIAYFVSAHGFGHGVRASALIGAMASRHRVTVYSGLPRDFFDQELAVAFDWVELELDCGCVQRDSVRIDVRATCRRARELLETRKRRLLQVARLLERQRAELVVGDIPPLAFAAAVQVGIPSAGVGNFNWVDIYAPLVDVEPGLREVVYSMERDYAQAGIYFSLFPGLEGRGFRKRVQAGLLARRGARRRQALAGTTGFDPDKKWCAVYVGGGLSGVDWSRLDAYADWQFFGLYGLPGAGPGYRLLNKNSPIPFADWMATADLVLGKLGYGLVSECLAYGTPVLFVPRGDFAEHPVLARAVVERGCGEEIPLERMRRLDIARELEKWGGYRAPTMEAAAADTILTGLGL